MREKEIAAAFDFLLRLKGWKVADLARAAKLSVRETRATVKGGPSSSEIVDQLCDTLGFPLWLFWWVGTVTSAPADSRELKDLWPQLEGGATLHRLRGLELVKEGMLLLVVEIGATPSKQRPTRRHGKADIRAAWLRIGEHVEALRLITGELTSVSGGESSASPDLLGRLANHGVGVWQAIADLESIGHTLAATIVEERDSTCTGEGTSR